MKLKHSDNYAQILAIIVQKASQAKKERALRICLRTALSSGSEKYYFAECPQTELTGKITC